MVKVEEAPKELFTFEGRHYGTWKIYMKAKLVRKDIWKYVTELGAKGNALACKGMGQRSR